MPALLRIESPLEGKKRAISSLLSDKVGLVIRGKNCVVVAIKSPHKSTIRLEKCPDGMTKLFIWGLSGSMAARRRFDTELNRFENELRNRFSSRDLNFLILHDFISRLLAQGFYNRKSEEPVALEFILAKVERGSMSFSIINFDGDSRFLEDSSFAIIGCTDEKKREELERALTALGLPNLSLGGIGGIRTVIQPLLGEFGGKFGFFGISFEKSGKKSKKSKK